MYKSLILMLFSVVLSLHAAEQKMAVSTKVKGAVEVKTGDKATFSALSQDMNIFYNNDVIRTGTDGFIIIVFLDDKSQLKLWENCELTIRGNKDASHLNKNVSMDFGTIKAEINPLREGEFRIATPVSVMAVKGTDFWVKSSHDQGDQVIGLSGLVEVVNNLTGSAVTVGANQTGISQADGTLDVMPTKDNELLDLPEDTEKTPEGTIIRIPFTSPDGETKTLILEF